MPDRATSRGLLLVGVALVLAAAPLIAVPVLHDRAVATQVKLIAGDELQRVAAATTELRDTLDSLRAARTAQRDFLLSGAVQDRADYAAKLELARERTARLGDVAAPSMQWDRFGALANRLLQVLDDGAALRDACGAEAAMAASRLADSRVMMREIEEIGRLGVVALRQRFTLVMNQALTAGDETERYARLLFGIAGVSFALGCIALVAYQRRHLAAERSLRAGRDAALAASQLKTRFVATASHDLRQPLHAISMFVGVLRRRSADPAVREVVENVATAVASMQRMFAALLDVARLDAGAIHPARGLVRLQALYDSLQVEFSASATAKGLSLQIPHTAAAVVSDPAVLETILRNLLGNAVKFCDHGAVGIMTRVHGTTVEVTVFDTGIGISAEDRPRIFEQFERIGTTGNAREGLGLGLSIVRRMAELLGVPVALTSQPGLGSRFTLSLPHAETEAAAPLPAAAPLAELRGARILVLDDHDKARRAIAMAVETLGGVPSEAASPEAAMALMDGLLPAAPAAAIVDHDLGCGRTGPEFLDGFAARNGRALPAVVVTGSTDAATLARLRESGRPWLIKPVDLDVLGPVLARLVGDQVLDTALR